MIEIRPMKEDEAREVKKLGKKNFEWFESLFISNPKDCFVAVDDDRITGAVFYKYIVVNHKKIGYVDYIFVDKSVHGKGVGTRLVDECLGQMTADGCDGYSAIVRDDNVGSWKMFVNHGLRRSSLVELIRQFGFFGMLFLSFKTPFNIAVGMDFYLKFKEETTVDIKGNSLQQIAAYFILSLVLILPNFIYFSEEILNLFGAIALVLFIRLIFGYLGTLFSKEKWYFRVCNGGFFIPLVVSFLGSLFFISGNWYPRNYRKEADFKRSLGISSFAQWLSLLGIKLISLTSLGCIELFHSMGSLAGVFLIISIIPLYPLATFGGERIFKWNKIIYVLTVFVSVSVLFCQ